MPKNITRENDLREQNLFIIFNLILACAHAVNVICILAPITAQSLFHMIKYNVM